MKFRPRLTASLVLLFIATSAHAATFKHYGITIAGNLSTEVLTSSSTAKIQSTPVNNKTITSAIFASGTSGVLKASDLDIVFAGNSAQIQVIDKSNEQLVRVLAVSGTTSTNTTLIATSKGDYKATELVTDYEFSLPGAANTEPTTLVLHVTFNPVTDAVSKLSASFIGGESSGQTIFQGTIKKSKTVYP